MQTIDGELQTDGLLDRIYEGIADYRRSHHVQASDMMLLIHPMVDDLVQREYVSRSRRTAMLPSPFPFAVFGVECKVTDRVPATKWEWVFPHDGWIYDESDIELARYWGWGHSQLVPALFLMPRPTRPSRLHVREHAGDVLAYALSALPPRERGRAVHRATI